MKKKILCLLLAVLMLAPLMAGCSQTGTIESINEEASRFTNTLNVWLVTESKLVADASAVILKGITPQKEEHKTLTDEEKAVVAAMTEEQKAAWYQVWEVSEGVNKLTKAKYKTKLNLKFYLESDYYAAVEAAFKKHEESIAAGNVTVENKTEETVLNEYGIPELKYPSVADYEVDILFVGNYEKYNNYVKNKWLVDIRSHLSAAAVKLGSYVSLSYLTSAAVDGSVYALPNNHGVGEYVYVLADKKLLDSYNSDLTGATLYDTAFRDYLDYVYATYTDSNKVYPIYSESGKIDLDYAHYWGYDFDTAAGLAVQNPGQFNIFGDNNYNKTELGNTNLLTDAAYMKALANKTHYEKTEAYLTQDPDVPAAIRVVKGGWEMKAAYEAKGYEVMVMQYPTLNDDEVYSSMFAVGAYTVSDERSAEILTFLNTNAEVRNILQYGIENTNYTLESVEIDGKTYSYAKPTRDNIYVMDVDKTGNVFLTYPSSADEVLRWEYEKQQNLEMIKYPTLGLSFSSQYKIDEKNVRVMNAVSEKLAAVIANMTTAAEVEALYANACSNAASDRYMAIMILDYIGTEVTYTMNGETHTVDADALREALKLMAQTTPDEPKTGEEALQSPYYLYYDWAVRNEIIVVKNPGLA